MVSPWPTTCEPVNLSLPPLSLQDGAQDDRSDAALAVAAKDGATGVQARAARPALLRQRAEVVQVRGERKVLDLTSSSKLHWQKSSH